MEFPLQPLRAGALGEVWGEGYAGQEGLVGGGGCQGQVAQLARWRWRGWDMGWRGWGLPAQG